MKRTKLSAGIRGKRVASVEALFQEGTLHVGISFTDKTYLALEFSLRAIREFRRSLRRRVQKGVYANDKS